ncbi:hypothetical protein GCM10010234_35800 [Streptomyces hawaiiensis]
MHQLPGGDGDEGGAEGHQADEEEGDLYAGRGEEAVGFRGGPGGRTGREESGVYGERHSAPSCPGFGWPGSG